MNIQIIGTKKCGDTKKAIRFFQERGIKYHFVDLAERDLSPGEWDNIFRQFPPADLVDEQSGAYKKKGLAWMDYDPREELMENPGLLKTPLTRWDRSFTLGFDLKEFAGRIKS